MAMNKASVVELVNDHLLPAFRFEQLRIEEIDRWYRHEQGDIVIPAKATREHKALLELAKTPFLGLVVTTVAQALYGDGYRSPDDSDNEDAAPWRLWLENDLAARQGAIYRGALAYGHAYATALPGQDAFGVETAVLRGVSPRKMLAFYADPAEDDYPLYALRVERARGESWTMRFYDDESVHYLSVENGKTLWLEDRRHDVGVCPVVRYANLLDLDGRSDGEVVPFIPIAKRINKTTYDRLLTQHFNSWKVRTVAGMAEPDSDEEATAASLRLRQNDLLIAEDPDTKFSTLPETPLDGFIRAQESDIKTLAAVSQTPVHALTGDLINLSADALAAARSTLDAKVEERQGSFAGSHQRLLRLGARIVGDDASAADVRAHIVWRDTSIRSLSAAADALGKFAQMLAVPVEALWGMIPGVTKTDVEEWKQLARDGDSMSTLIASLATATEPAV